MRARVRRYTILGVPRDISSGRWHCCNRLSVGRMAPDTLEGPSCIWLRRVALSVGEMYTEPCFFSTQRSVQRHHLAEQLAYVIITIQGCLLSDFLYKASSNRAKAVSMS
jgi:hypothetical protein